MNPHCKAFTLDTEEELLEKFSLIPTDTDILITHSPMHNILDEICEEGKHVGSFALENVVNKRYIKLHVFGHIHESYGVIEFSTNLRRPIFVNASHVNQFYEAVNSPIRIIL